jgi:hypothetical protein
VTGRTRASAKAAGTRVAARLKVMPNGCHEWQGYRMPKGYGQISIDGRLVLTHRIAYEAERGPIPDGLLVRHTCDNPPCCNPAHLVVGTVADNSADAIERGQVARGARLPQTRLTERQVAEIRTTYRRYTVPGQRGYRSNSGEIAEQFGVSRQHVNSIIAGRDRASV